VDTRITGVRPVEPSRTPVPPPREPAREQVARPDPDLCLAALTVALVACVGAALIAATQHVTLWPAFLLLALFVLAEMAEACRGR
jgi:hypothetical protein